MLFRSQQFSEIAKLVKLDKPLVIFDIETTGLDISSDKIIEIAYIKIFENGKVEKDSFLINPEMPIPRESTIIHNINDETVANSPTFKKIAQQLWEVFNNCYYSGFNIINFDLLILRREFVRVGMDFEYHTEQIIDSKKIFQHMAPINLSSAYEYYSWKAFNKKRSSMSHAETAAEILIKQFERYNELSDKKFLTKIHKEDSDINIDNIRKFYWRNGEACFSFSKYKDKPISEVAKKDRNFLEWIIAADFTEETKRIIKTALERIDRKEAQNSKLKAQD
ncbi:hypothetical protein A2331_05995 [Candidatus Falkowbacteria bacterium RIFOXYB2_FULL_34_18]|uniref:Exonuclease domain-containing protein n=1 Tax=Candidatus Falkowbacteria bacterium RIFOXYD2_FULL_34_120 TaxID=1798007 RepID=A0A1F5TP30_9BACT|nr:MAG: hypothetical protein A2331_05995 [Candidatus Falkowbacteria bacterium RIFOXYB2_FULL_34_18]OGF29060.1 MAG: hypothetical protein A2500_03400 [Candidatus Falkowbacteria bacterium RIFOXYC12_FULL_34_55]OGF36130.1 MAG: hypothetical protein A2466_03570 [Candidatus Falkowbacteria bacterium RIFOXYC2_FULL_34_220]OGF38582.1 MAG: hypothetical protein A2515_04830 [Candidatus Falkowbacteria bacterium RIFOXYD12_FULL_34_57]OGF40745.1 MAG: hypothetical protein A2531_06925 [Candidatus Falkowbacteria bact